MAAEFETASLACLGLREFGFLGYQVGPDLGMGSRKVNMYVHFSNLSKSRFTEVRSVCVIQSY